MRSCHKKYLVVAAIGAAIFFLSVSFFRSRPDGKLRVDFFSVGQGDASLITTPDGKRILIDGGPNSRWLDQLDSALGLWNRTIDLVILTHPHDDHVGGFDEVFKRYKVRKVALTGVVHTSPAYLSWLKTVRDGKYQVIIIDRPQTIELDDGCRLEILSPLKDLSGKTIDNLNNSSIVSRLVFDETCILFAADAEIELEKDIIASGVDLSADILKIGHHGSDTATSDDWLASIKPKISVISVGAGNDFGHPNERTIKKLERASTTVYRTDQDGEIRFVSDGRSIWRD